MKPSLLTAVAAALLGAATLRAQTSADQTPAYIPPAPPAPQAEYVPPPPPPPPAYGYGYNRDNGGTTLAGSISLPYAFNWNAAGISGELGGLWDQRHFLGGEISYYDGSAQRYDVFNRGTFIGRFNSSLQVTTVDLAYKYFAPLWNLGPRNPVTFYLGGSGGVGFVNYSDTGAGFGFTNGNNNNADFTAEFVTGLHFSLGQASVLRLGYRYVTVTDVSRFNQNVDLNTSVLEAAFAFHF